MRVSAAGNMPLQGLVKPPAKPVVMIRRMENCIRAARAHTRLNGRIGCVGRDRAA